MRQYIWVLGTFFLGLATIGLALAQAEPETAVVPDGVSILTSRTNHNGLLNTSHQGIFGPAICTAWGDPFSPRFSSFETPKPRNPDGTYSYTYRIRVPQSYRAQYHLLQIELFDPDSINQDVTDEAVLIRRTAVAQSLGMAAEEVARCDSGSARNRWNPCLIKTGEYTLTQTMTPTLAIDDINPLWFVRVDENRGTGESSQHGDYTCQPRFSYSPYHNTETHFELYYFQALSDVAVSRVGLSQYTGQVGDGIRDIGDHQTDLRWVTPGITAGVPVDAGKPFLLDISQEGDVPGILVDPVTGDLNIYLDVTTVTGASENGFELWAGPPVAPTLPDNVNARNLYLLDNSGVHDSVGVEIYGVRNLPQNSNIGLTINEVQEGKLEEPERLVEAKRPLTPLTAEHAGQTLAVTLYDPDAGAVPPITFTIDTISEADWSITFGLEPEGRCFEVGQIIDAQDPFACGSQWIEPSYLVEIPEAIGDCPDNCQPFAGGTLQVNFRAGLSDTFVWDVQFVTPPLPPPTPTPTSPTPPTPPTPTSPTPPTPTPSPTPTYPLYLPLIQTH